MPGELNSPYRFDPFDGNPETAFRPRWNEGDEEHVAELHESNGRVGFFTFEAAQAREIGVATCESLATGGGVLTEVARLTIPASDQFRVDYDTAGFTGTSFWEVHESRLGETFVVGYYGLGTPPRWNTRLMANLDVDQDAAIAGDLEVGQDAGVSGETVLHGNVQLAAGTGSEISASGHTINDVGEAIDPTDGVPLAQAEGLIAAHGVEILSGSGNWTPPEGVTKVLFVAIGSGGSGATTSGGGGGGGGGGSVYGIADIAAIGGSSFAYVVGTVGNDTTIFGCTAAKGSAATTATGGTGGSGTVGANVIGKSATGGAGGNGSGSGVGGGGGASAGGFGGTGAAGSGVTGGASSGFYSGPGGNGGATGPSNGVAGTIAGGGGGGSGGGGGTTAGVGATGIIILVY